MIALLLAVACSSPAPAPTPSAAPAAAPTPAAAPAPVSAGQQAPLPVGRWYYDVSTPGIGYVLDVQPTWAKFTAEGVQTSINVEGELRGNASGGWDFVVTRDAGSLTPYAAGTTLFKVMWSGSTIVGENTDASVLETGGGAIAPFSQTPPPAAKMGSCSGDAWRCDGQAILHCQGGSWVITETCDAEHSCDAHGSPAACLDKGQQ